MTRQIFSAAILFTMATGTFLFAAEEVSFVEENGTTYRVTRTITKYPVNVVRTEERVETVYTDRYSTEMKQEYRTVYTPVTEYRWTPRVHGAWNPFVPNYVAYHLVPHTYWKLTRQSYQVPVIRHEVVPEKRIVRVQVPSLQFAEREEIHRVPISTTPILGSKSRTSVAQLPRFGGIKEESDSLLR